MELKEILKFQIFRANQIFLLAFNDLECVSRFTTRLFVQF